MVENWFCNGTAGTGKSGDAGEGCPAYDRRAKEAAACGGEAEEFVNCSTYDRRVRTTPARGGNAGGDDVR
ncbi:hypothetical protein CONPUDRAFT_78648 [Coniophora puteana RWD-64-598 SS2]|uniref:Uncharacterized protein n=1 Tax=Coniophora puteana (strain RWD-64-598) TaxID=741705 RepID=A0A5M3N5S3_CONPW|nr:uncharacterized protein CONPUDRAFT_78648 [Coniophora puteana RWD-64-598 SS2]EIW86215.1 hypothetical protein CONPUDRAFT_78648 [Coniophora puteana RWD-64-598 SS2]